MKDANRAMLELRRESQKYGYVVYDICVRKAGFGVLYCDATNHPVAPIKLVFRYWPTLMAALEGERKAWKKHGKERWRNE